MAIAVTSTTYCSWITFALPFQILYWFKDPVGVCSGANSDLNLYFKNLQYFEYGEITALKIHSFIQLFILVVMILAAIKIALK